MKRYIHVWELPTDKVYINLEAGFRKRFFDSGRAEFGTWRALGEFLGVPRGDTTLAINWKKDKQCFPLSACLKLCRRLKISKRILESKIITIRYKQKLSGRGGSSGKPIIDPILPIRIDENFAEIIGHICGDGSVSRSNTKKGIGFRYINSEPVLIKNFRDLVRRVFGEVEPNIQVRTGGHYSRPNYYLQYPSIISAFVLLVFDYQPGENMELPHFVFNMPKLARARFLRAMFDDEANVKRKGIVIGLKPIKPLIDIQRLLSMFDIKFSKINYYPKEHPRMRRFGISSMRGLKQFKRLIGFKHPEKSKRLEVITIRPRRFERYDDYESGLKIAELLSNNEILTTSEISRTLIRCKRTVHEHLRNMQKEGIVLCSRVKNFNMWRLNK